VFLKNVSAHSSEITYSFGEKRSKFRLLQRFQNHRQWTVVFKAQKQTKKEQWHELWGIIEVKVKDFLRSESHETRGHVLLSLFLRLPQPGEPGSCIYSPQKQGNPVIPQSIGFVRNIPTERVYIISMFAYSRCKRDSLHVFRVTPIQLKT
jgi:hypothetical protein